MNGHTLVRLLCTSTETPNINYSSCEQTHSFDCCVRPQRLLISTTAHVNGHTLVRLLCTATETPNINYSSCERTHSFGCCVRPQRLLYQLRSCERTHNLFSCCVRPQRLLISTTAHVNSALYRVALSIVFTVQGRLIHFKRTP